MTTDPFHLAWFLQGSSIQAWGAEWTGNISEEWMSADMFLDLARNIERAGFDYLLLEDSIYIGQNWQNKRDIFLKNGMSVPRQEPTVVASLMMAATSRLGIVPTLSTFAYHPYLTARIVGTLDQVSGGRAGWNMVTGSSDFSAQNFGMDQLPPHDRRYDMAAEYIDIVTQLWSSWEPGAIVADRKSGVLIDPEKVHTIDFAGEYYKSRGPLNSGPCPQGRPVIAQAGGSAKGRAIAARYADTIVAHPKGIEGMKDYRNDVRAQMRAFGRDPDSCKILFMAVPVIGETSAEAREKAAMRKVKTAENVDRAHSQGGRQDAARGHRQLQQQPGIARSGRNPRRGGRADGRGDAGGGRRRVFVHAGQYVAPERGGDHRRSGAGVAAAGTGAQEVRARDVSG
jgi:FMN-dependent oxidoreductase (nitrilotriacetate monooxygenase family)